MSSSNVPTYAGPLNFFRQPTLGADERCDLLVFGVPFDLATSGRSGARLGPRGVRVASAMISWGQPFFWGFDPFRHLSVRDGGDAEFDYGLPGEAGEAIERWVSSRVLPRCRRFVCVGGDHFVAYPNLRALRARHEAPISLVHFDAHPDTWPDPPQRRRRADHGSMFFWAIREGLVDATSSVTVGVRTHVDDPLGVTLIPALEVHEGGVRSVLERILRIVSAEKAPVVYVTVDVDCLDPSVAPGTGTPVPGGLMAWQLLALLRGLRPLAARVVGADVVEVAPPFDHAEITSLVGAQIALELICLMASESSSEIDEKDEKI